MYKLAIVDIDQTIADCTHRSHLVDGAQKNWDEFLKPELVVQDTLIPGAKRGLLRLMASGFTIVFLTGRNSSLQDATTTWLKTHLPEFSKCALLMRPVGDRSVATKMKARLIATLVSTMHPEQEVVLAFDDDKFMAAVYQKYNILWHHAPQCWDTFCVEHEDLPEEVSWRK